jgi:hypothetical protein
VQGSWCNRCSGTAATTLLVTFSGSVLSVSISSGPSAGLLVLIPFLLCCAVPLLGGVQQAAGTP